MKVAMFTCCQSASIDRQNNSLSIFNVIEELNSPVFPLAVSAFTIVLMLLRDVDDPDDVSDFRCKMHLAGQQVLNAEFKAQFQGRRAVKIVSKVQGMLLSNPGDLVVTIHHRDAQLGEWTVIARKIGEAQLDVETVPTQ